MKCDRICANCGRMDDHDFARRYCPVRARCVLTRVPTNCKAFIPIDSPESKRGNAASREDPKCT